MMILISSIIMASLYCKYKEVTRIYTVVLNQSSWLGPVEQFRLSIKFSFHFPVVWHTTLTPAVLRGLFSLYFKRGIAGRCPVWNHYCQPAAKTTLLNSQIKASCALKSLPLKAQSASLATQGYSFHLGYFGRSSTTSTFPLLFFSICIFS